MSETRAYPVNARTGAHDRPVHSPFDSAPHAVLCTSSPIVGGVHASSLSPLLSPRVPVPVLYSSTLFFRLLRRLATRFAKPPSISQEAPASRCCLAYAGDRTELSQAEP